MMSLFQQSGISLVLASASTVRADMLRGAGLRFDVRPSPVDEDAVKSALKSERGEITGEDLATILAQTKATSVSEQEPSALVIGADQVLGFEGRFYDKPKDMDEARDALIAMRGKTHVLHTATACAEAGDVIWHHESSVTLTMRDFSNDFLGTYLAACGEDILTSVGAYKLEGPGAQLFERIEGDYFSVLGLPLLPLLQFLRSRGAIES